MGAGGVGGAGMGVVPKLAIAACGRRRDGRWQGWGGLGDGRMRGWWSGCVGRRVLVVAAKGPAGQRALAGTSLV